MTAHLCYGLAGGAALTCSLTFCKSILATKLAKTRKNRKEKPLRHVFYHEKRRYNTKIMMRIDAPCADTLTARGPWPS